jgi:hypothetical protein
MIVVIYNQRNKYYITWGYAMSCPFKDICPYVIADLAQFTDNIYVSPLNGYGTNIYEQSKTLFANADSNFSGFINYKVLDIEYNYPFPKHEWINCENKIKNNYK